MKKHYHLIGIGGIGMSGIAKLLLDCGYKVSGSDLKESPVTLELEKKGAQIFIGHKAENVDGADVVVYSSAVKGDNPEAAQAKSLGISVVMRAEALACLMKDKGVIAVAGSHGKTTTTSLVACLLLEAGLFPTVAIGGILKNIETNACLGGGKFFVAEADESDGSFLYYKPNYSIITNIDREHLDYYKSFEKELDAFREFIDKTDIEGCVFGSADDKNLADILRGSSKRHILFGLNENADIYPKDVKFKGLSSEFECIYKNNSLGRFNLALGGEHNISNALSVIALGMELGIDLGFTRKALSGYKGAGRRLEIKYENQSFKLIDDYAHHPTEIQATLKAAKRLKHNRLIAVFQPHRYSRTQLLLDDFAKSFQDADYIIITDIYAASENPIEGVGASLLVDKIRRQGKARAVDYFAKDKIIGHIEEIIKPGDLLITLGAGDIAKVSDELAERIKNKI
ncbi:MAG: UDP-N-acetylmuramate--L-alanine ligase [Candidatus Omnitrophota bacterium]